MPKDELPRPQGLRLGRNAKPFVATDAAHVIVRTAEKLGWDISDFGKFARQVQHVEYGLSSEIEFAAILRWLGWCRFVHRLSEDVFEDEANSAFNVPDLLATFRLGDATFTAAIEVKTSNDTVLKFKTSYLEKLRAYATMIGQPLLIAWRPRSVGFWILFDPEIFRPAGADSLEVDLGEAIANDLMSMLAGDYYIVPKEAAGFRILYERTGEKQPTADGYQAVFQITDAYLHDAAGQRTENVPDSLVWSIISTFTNEDEIKDDSIVQSFVASGDATRAQLVLRTAIGFSLNDEERIHWKSVGNNLDAILKAETLLKDASERFGTFVSYVFHQQPQITPSFIPLDWVKNLPDGRRAQDR